MLFRSTPNAVVVPVANPLDAMSQALFKLTKFPRERIIGMAGVLDSARMSTFIAMELNVSVENINSFVLGGHGDTMVPLPRLSTVAGIPITELLSKDKIDAIATRTANGGAEITKLVGTSAWYAPGQAAAEMVEAILKDTNGEAARKDREALAKIADVAIEVLVSSRQLVIREVSGDKVHQVPDIQVTAIRLKDAAILGQASASDILGKDRYAGRIITNFDVREITEAVALALMEDMTLGK